MKNILPILVFGFVLFIAGNAMAKFTYEGHLTDLSDNPLSNQVGTINISVVGPASACVVFMESHAILTDNKGFFSVQVGGGTDIDALANTLDSVFSNLAAINGMSCTYTPVAGDGRRLKIDVATGGGFEALGFVALGKSPQAAHADAVGGYNVTNLVRTSGTAPLLSSSDVTSLTQLIAGTSTLYATAGGGVTSVTGTSPITSSGGPTPAISISQASATGAGFLTSADWTTFSNKLGNGSTVNSGDLSGTFGSLVVAKIRGYPVSATAPASGDVLKFVGSQYVPMPLPPAPVTSVASKTGIVTLVPADIVGLGTAALKNVGTSVGTVAAGDDPRMVNGLTTTLPFNQAFLGNVSNVATARYIFLGDIRSSAFPANPAFNIAGGCSSGDMISYFSLSGEFTCQPFSLTPGQVTSALGFTPLGAASPILMPFGNAASPSYSFSGNTSTGLFSPGPGELAFSSSATEMMRLTSVGNVGIGTTVPDSRLSVFGTMRATSISGSHFHNSAASIIDFAQGNNITSTHGCGGNIFLQNIRDGGNYKIAVLQGTTPPCVFDVGVTGQDSGTVIYKYSPANAARSASSDTTYELSRFGNTVYVKWAPY